MLCQSMLLLTWALWMLCLMWLCLASAPSRRLQLLKSQFMHHVLYSSASCSAGHTIAYLHIWLLLALTPETPAVDPFCNLFIWDHVSWAWRCSSTCDSWQQHVRHHTLLLFLQSGYLGAAALCSQQPQQHDHFTVRSSAAGSPSQVVQLGKLMSRTAVSAAAAAVSSADSTQRRAQIAVGSSGRAVPSGKLWLRPLQCCILRGSKAAIHLLEIGIAHCQGLSAATWHPLCPVTQPCA